ncbi:hypothetical protein SLG_38480 [Sphingobium sp. SYK-6]|uniref:murein L,D-transpeptidase catalytic domain family protein n=1 Tax=Sphingobium sp. (strain NBRC 103272 / SYK-6) TaxID=627192 RepID=UPI0002277FE6|nr:murein L,D-transpeptidase catalytic domain family protein [Sphingobium sp. SYK-6]BAK68523.1 hypothetical protein SLG_38480 [Sphingobium sp. SYK-6]
MSSYSRFHRRHFLKFAGGAAASSLLMPSAALAAGAGDGWTKLLERARQALDQHEDVIRHRDRLVLVDFSLPSATPRMMLVDLTRGRRQLLRVSHGRGSDPAHSGWLRSFSNVSGSNASSRGAYITAATYQGKHGRSQRLVGLEESNNNAEARAIVIHGAWYSNDDVAARLGKLGRSEGCFAVSEAQIDPLLDWLGPERLLYADRV